MASDEHAATALGDFAKALAQTSHVNPTIGALSEDQDAERRKRLRGLSARVQAMAASPRTATYQEFLLPSARPRPSREKARRSCEAGSID
jgi:hypothetical protein